MARRKTRLIYLPRRAGIESEPPHVGCYADQDAALAYLKNAVIEERVIKHGDRAKADRFFNVP